MRKELIERHILKQIKEKIKELILRNPEGKLKEMCGVVVESGAGIEVREVKNESDSSEVHYSMCPKDLSDKSEDSDLFRNNADKKLLAIWHTHPFTDSNPSQTDVCNCLTDRNYIIYSIPNDSMTVFKKQVL